LESVDEGEFNPKDFVDLKSLLFTILKGLDEKTIGPSSYFKGGKVPMKEFRERLSFLKVTQ
jgi:hypothetical protein